MTDAEIRLYAYVRTRVPTWVPIRLEGYRADLDSRVLVVDVGLYEPIELTFGQLVDADLLDLVVSFRMAKEAIEMADRFTASFAKVKKLVETTSDEMETFAARLRKIGVAR